MHISFTFLRNPTNKCKQMGLYDLFLKSSARIRNMTTMRKMIVRKYIMKGFDDFLISRHGVMLFMQIFPTYMCTFVCILTY